MQKMVNLNMEDQRVIKLRQYMILNIKKIYLNDTYEKVIKIKT